MAGLLNLNKAKVREFKLATVPKAKSDKIQSINMAKISEDVKKETSTRTEMDIIREFYIEHSSKPTCAETARRYNIDPESIAKIAKDENWFEQRLIHWNKDSADQQQAIHSASKNIFKSLSIISQLAMKEHAEIMIEIDKAKKQDIIINPDSYSPAHNIKDAMALVKLLNTNTGILKEQLNQSEKTLAETDDSELLELLSEDERYELDIFYNFEEAEDEDEVKLKEMNVF